jgi:hypothetical protein
MVGARCSGIVGGTVLTTKQPSTVTAPSARRFPSASMIGNTPDGALSQTGAAAATRTWWLRNEPPKAEEKKRSHRVNSRASAASGSPAV